MNNKIEMKMKKMISILTVLVLSIVTMLPVKVMAAEYPHKNSEVKQKILLLRRQRQNLGQMV